MPGKKKYARKKKIISEKNKFQKTIILRKKYFKNLFQEKKSFQETKVFRGNFFFQTYELCGQRKKSPQNQDKTNTSHCPTKTISKLTFTPLRR